MANDTKNGGLVVPPRLIEPRQWVIWRRESRNGGKPTKRPYTAMGYPASHSNPDHWSHLGVVLDAAARPGFCDGIGFVFSKDDPLCGIDLDNLWPVDEAHTPAWGQAIIDRFADTYMECSPSGMGLKIWCLARAPRCGKWPVERGAVEIYDHARFFAFTGQNCGVLDITDHQNDINELVMVLAGNGKVGNEPVAVAEKIPQGKRHNSLMSLAGTMWRRGMCVEAVTAALAAINRHQCDPPYDDEHISEILKTVAGWTR